MIAARRIAVLRALKLGDLLCTVPAFRALRAACPFAEIRLIGLPWAADLVRRYDGYLDGLFVLPGFPSFPEAPFDARAFTRFLDTVQQWAPDLVLQMHGSGTPSNHLATLLGGAVTAGYTLPGQFCPEPERFITYPSDLPEVQRHLRLLGHLGIEAQGTHKELPRGAADDRALTDLMRANRLDGPYAVVHPGASVPEHCWPPERFAAVADGLAAQGLQIVLTGSPGEAQITSAVAARMRAPCIDLTGQTNLGTLGALLAKAAILVSNDTGVMHVGEAVGAPLVAVSFDTEAWRWAPEDRERCRVFPDGMSVGADAVLGAARDRLCSRTNVLTAAQPPAGRTPDDLAGRPERG